VIEALAGVADEEAIVLLARIGRRRSELANSVLSALDEIDHARATAAASGLRQWLGNSDRRVESSGMQLRGLPQLQAN
jgi:hypothetical protein